MRVEVTAIECSEKNPTFTHLRVLGTVGACDEEELFSFFGRQDEPLFCRWLAYAALVRGGICVECAKHLATANWVGDGGTMAYIHGQFERWCECCCTKAALEHCRESVARIPELEAKLLEPCL